jgi:hypothetical protein
MPGVYHILTNPLQSTALDTDPDPDDDGTPDTGTPAQILRRQRIRKFRKRAMGWLISVAIDRTQLVRFAKDNSQIVLETDDVIPSLPAGIEGLFVLKNQTLVAILAFFAANSGNW